MSANIIEISKIEEIVPIEKADRIVLAKVKGWHCITQKDIYKVGDLCIFIPPDSIIPPYLIEKYKLEFLKKDGRVKTLKLRGVISQGLILDLDCLPISNKKMKIYTEGENVAEELGIIKWEPQEADYNLSNKKETIQYYWKKYREEKITLKRLIFKSLGLIKDKFKPKKKTNPYFDKYTDIENINNYNNVIQEGENVIISEKLHGTNSRYGYLKIGTNSWVGLIKRKIFGEYEFVYGSRTIQKKFINLHNGYYKEDVWGKILLKYKIDEWLPKDYILYGEIIGCKIQDLTYDCTDIDFYLFDVKYKNKYLDWKELEEFYNNVCNPKGIKFVPILFEGKYNNETRKLLSEGNSIICSSQIREGCVVKPLIERYDHKLGRVILKSISKTYLLRSNGSEFK